MEEIIKSCVESRKNAIYSAYEINNEELKSKIDDLFSRIENFAESCTSVTDFESKFAASELNQEYNKKNHFPLKQIFLLNLYHNLQYLLNKN